MILQETYSLSNGLKIPKLGLGTWFIPDDQAARAVREAVKLGYRHIDAAQAYENDRGVREELSDTRARGFQLQSAAVRAGGCVWLRYLVQNTED